VTNFWNLDDLRGIAEGKVNLLHTRLRQSLFQQFEKFCDPPITTFILDMGYNFAKLRFNGS
jgi:hypothetical protein